MTDMLILACSDKRTDKRRGGGGRNSKTLGEKLVDASSAILWKMRQKQVCENGCIQRQGNHNESTFNLLWPPSKHRRRM